MKLSELYPSKYLKAGDLDGDTTVTIQDVTTETMKKKDGTDEEKPVLVLEELKPVVLNVTNARSIASLYGDDTDDWIGKQVVLYTAEVDAFGEATEAIRIRNKMWMDKRKSKAPTLVPARSATVVPPPNGTAPKQPEPDEFVASDDLSEVPDEVNMFVAAWSGDTQGAFLKVVRDITANHYGSNVHMIAALRKEFGPHEDLPQNKDSVESFRMTALKLYVCWRHQHPEEVTAA